MTEGETVSHFVESAEAFCSLIEQHQSLTAAEFVCQSAPCLAELYRAAVLLSLWPVETDTEDLIEDAVSTEQAQAVDRGIGQKLGSACLYWEVFDPREESDPVVGDLGDDLADIYREVKNGLAAFNKGPANEAIGHWQWGFRFHWGDHVVDALRVMHRIVCASLEKE
ncbi:MAG: DUF5063 domain-containing protein [Armatimonadota bacterium]|nr:DUF5063 domain-containing protein [Armatimonadota bacterium]